MSKEFYNYLANRTFDFFNTTNLKIGDKFILKLDNEQEVENYYSAIEKLLTEKGVKETFSQMDDELFETDAFTVNNGVKLVIIPKIDITDAYFTRLRNTVPGENAMFIVCQNSIDSIEKGMEDFQKEGMPFHKDKLIVDIKSEIDKSNLQPAEKQVLYFDLENKANADHMDMYSISDYSDILAILYKKCIEDDDFRHFGLFPDEEITTISLDIGGENAIKNRIRENNKNYKIINDSVNEGNIDDLERLFSEDLIDKVKKNDPEHWDDGITYTAIEKSLKKNKLKGLPLEITSIDVSADNIPLRNNIEYFVRSEGSKGAGLRKQHVLIFNSNKAKNIEIAIGISDFLGKNTIAFEGDKDILTSKVSGKKVIINIQHTDISISKVKIRCVDRNDKFDISFCVINCSKKWFDEATASYLINAKAQKNKKKALIINCDSDELVFNRHGEETEKIHLESDIVINHDECEKCTLKIDEKSFNDDGTANALVNIDGAELPVIFWAVKPINTSISGIKIEQQKLKLRQSYIYRGNNKLALGTNEYNTREELRENLIIEEHIVNTQYPCYYIQDDNITFENINISDKVLVAYKNFLEYFKVNDTLPSLAYYNEELSELALKYVNAVIEELNEVKEESPLITKHKDLLRLGTVSYAEERIAFSPVHPINVAYQLQLTGVIKELEELEAAEKETKLEERKDEQSAALLEETKNGEEAEGIREDILKKLSADNLVPFIHDSNGDLYKVNEQTHSPHWTYYCHADRKKYKGSRNFVSDLTCEKICDFREHFRYLFDSVGSKKIIINAVNMGDCRNLFKGIVDYYKSEIKSNSNDFLSIVVNVYDDSKIYNVFEVLSHKTALKVLLNEIGIKEDNKSFSESEFINLIMSNVVYYRKNKNSDKYDYCHLAFIEMDNETTEEFSNKNEIRSGTMLNGLLSGVTSMYYGESGSGSYRTGYGCKFNLPENSENHLMVLTEYYNSMMYVYGKGNPYRSNDAICTSIDKKETDVINKTYDASNWVVFIDPKVDLNFFKNDEKDIMIIHYSDQHTTSSGYDAITVTRKTEQYENILREFMMQNGLPTGERGQIRKMIDMFNAVNGDWLLKLISSKSNFSKEKISIQSAIKLALVFYKNDNIMWIPISLEEILRVSGAVGYSKEGGLFSSKNLGYEHGATSDDLLMFGVEVNNGKVRVHLYPLEVKIGYKDNNEITKAVKQVKQTRKILYDNLVKTNSLQAKIYRNFIAQLAVISADKLNLYNVWEHQDWERIVNSDIRGKLLNDDFEIANSLDEEIGDGIVISFKSGAFTRDVAKQDNVTTIKFLYSDGIHYITKTVDEIYQDIGKMEYIKRFLLENIYLDSSKTDDELVQKSILGTEPIVSNSTKENPDDMPTIAPISVEFNNDDKNNKTIDVDSDENVQEVETIVASITEEKSPDGIKILFGNDVNTGKPLYWYPNDTEKIMHPNTGIIGTMGTGKTQFTKSLILQLVREQLNNPGDKPLGILIFDYKGDYNQSKIDFVKATKAKVYDLYHLPFNPFSITVNANSKPMLPLHIANTFKDTLSKTYNLGVKQETALRDCIMHAYEIKGIDKAVKGTWNNTPPVLSDVYKIYVDSEAFKEDSLYSALSELNEFEIFEPDAEKTMPLYDLINGVTVINLAGYDPSIQNLVVAITLDLFYSQMQANGHSLIEGKLRQLTKFILVDEADNFLKVGFPSLRKILKEGREFGVGTILSTQFLKHFDTQDDDFAKYIFSWIVHNVADLSMKDVKNLFNTNDKSTEEELYAAIKKLSKHHSFVKFGDSSNPQYIKDRAFWELLKDEQNL